MAGIKLWHGYPVDPDTGETLTERSYIWRAEVNGEGVCWTDVIAEFDPQTGSPMMWGTPIAIDETEYRYFCETARWAKRFSPEAPEANPDKSIDFKKLEPLF